MNPSIVQILRTRATRVPFRTIVRVGGKQKLRVSSPQQMSLEFGVATLVGGARLPRRAHGRTHPSEAGSRDPTPEEIGRKSKHEGRQGSEGVRSPRQSFKIKIEFLGFAHTGRECGENK